MEYICLIFVPISIGWIGKKAKNIKANNAIAIQLFFIILFILLACRADDVGIDLPGYKYIFSTSSNYSWPRLFGRDIEVGYIILNKLVSLVTNDFQWFLAVVAALTLFPIAKIYSEDGDYSTIKILLFVNMSIFPMLFSGLRQSLAFAMGMLAYECVKNKKIIWFLLMVFMAYLFHRSAFVLLALYPVYYMRLKRKHLFVIIPVMLMIFIFNGPIFMTLARLSSDILGEAKISNNDSYMMILLFILFSIFSFVIPDEEKMDDETIGLRNILLLATCMQFFVPLHSLAMRINYYFIIFIPILIPKILKVAQPSLKGVADIANVVLCLFFAGYFIYLASNGENALNIYPYISFWEDNII